MAVAQRGPMNVCPPFCQEVILELAFFFSRAQHGVRGQCGVVHDRAGFFENNIFAPRNGENRPSLGFFECIRKIIFFSISSAIKFILIAVCLDKSYIW